MVVDLLGQSGLAAHLYRRIPIIALSIFCPPSGGQRRPPPTASPSPPASCPNTEGADGPGTGASPLLPTDPERTGGYHVPVLSLFVSSFILTIPPPAFV